MSLKAGKEIIFIVPYSLVLHHRALTNNDRMGTEAVVPAININNHRLLILYASGHLLVNLLSYAIILSMCIYSDIII
jgi:hypothetical protein